MSTNKGRFISACIVGLMIATSMFSQEDTIRGTYLPYGQKTEAKRSDTIVKVKVVKEKPNSMLGKVLYYLGPVKYEMQDSIYPMYTEEDPFFSHQKNHSLQAGEVQLNEMYSEAHWNRKRDIDAKPVAFEKDTSRALTRQVIGYHPFWMGSAYNNYNFNLLTRIAFFSYVVNPRTGNSTNPDYWSKTGLIKRAHQTDCKVDLTITNFGTRNNELFLSNTEAQSQLIENVVKLLKRKGGDGINVNFEAIPKQHKVSFSNFIKKLDTRLTQENPDYKITVTLPAISWKNAYDVAFLKDYADYFFLMGYDFYGKFSQVAGPTSLLYSGADWSEENINTTIENYLEFGLPRESLILGLPYYGNEWVTEDGNVPSKVKKYNGARSYRFISKNYADKYAARYDSASHSIYYVFRDSVNWIQCWYDNEQTLGVKYDYINEKRLGGLGIWALGYDNSFLDLWSLIERKFVRNVDVPDLHTRLSQTLEYSVSKKTISEINIAKPDYLNRFNDKLSLSWKIFTLLFAVIMVFAIIGFIITVADFDIRFVLFNKEVRVYIFFILIAVLTLLMLRVVDILKNSDVMLILAIIFGVFAALMLLNVGNSKKADSGIERP